MGILTKGLGNGTTLLTKGLGTIGKIILENVGRIVQAMKPLLPNIIKTGPSHFRGAKK